MEETAATTQHHQPQSVEVSEGSTPEKSIQLSSTDDGLAR